MNIGIETERQERVPQLQIEVITVRPRQMELIPIGEYNGIDVEGVITGGVYGEFDNIKSKKIIDSDYKMWLEVPNPEYDCEVIYE